MEGRRKKSEERERKRDTGEGKEELNSWHKTVEGKGGRGKV